MRQRNGEFSFLRHYMLLEDEVLFGFCQYYDCFYAQEEWYSVEMAGQIYSIDYLIGEEAYLRKGYGKAIVKALVNKIKAESPEAKIIVQPEEENLPSCKALLASGFIFDDEKRYYILV